MRLGRRMLAITAAAAMVSIGSMAGAAAVEVDHSTRTDSFAFRTTGLCGFAVRVSLHSTDIEITRFDGENFTVIDQVSQTTRFTNVVTGTYVTRVGHYTVISTPESSTTSGSHGRVLDADGNLLFTDSGHLVYDQSLDLVKFTPHIAEDRFDQLLCDALS
jgi:hypothetical protein